VTQSEYAKSGVNIDAGQKAVDLMKAAVRATYTPAVLSDTGSFGGLFHAAALKNLSDPILVASTDGVGTKTKVAARLNRWDTIGQDLVNHCINDILVQGAKPLFFMDYVASDKLVPEQIAAIVQGMAKACQEAGCALLGGETAEMPGVYMTGEVDVAGTIVGVVDRPNLIDGKTIEVGDIILALPSTGLHTNGYSLARRVLENLDWQSVHPDLGVNLGDALIAVHRAYLREAEALWAAGLTIRGMAHITGGGIVDNLPRIFAEGIGAEIDTNAWEVPAIFTLLQSQGEIEPAEMRRVFNMGLGMLFVLSPAEAEQALSMLPEMRAVGGIIAGSGVTFIAK
jgi:phosphoribosylformylglycinamidine cyclo-ligase